MNHDRFSMPILYGGATVLTLVCLVILRPFLSAVAWAVVLAIVLAPVHHRLQARFARPSLSALVTCLIFILAVLWPGLALAFRVADEAQPLLQNLQEAAATGRLLRWLMVGGGHGPVHQWLQHHTGFSEAEIQNLIQQAVGQLSAVVTRYSLGLARNLVFLLVQILLVLVTCFFLLRDSGRILPLLGAVLPLRSKQMEELLALAADTVRTSAYSQVVVAVVQGSLGGLSFWFVGFPSPLLWTAVMTVLCLVPVLGAPVVWGPAAIYLLTQGAYWQALGVVAWGLLVVGTIDNLLRPLLIGSRAQLHPLLALFGILGGAIVMGPLGLILGPVVLVLMRAVLEMIAATRRPGAHETLGTTPLDGHATTAPEIRCD